MRRSMLVLLALALTGCGLARPATAPLSQSRAAIQAQAQNYSGVYLCVSFKPSSSLERLAAQLRQQLGFLDMTKAIPPRSGDELHVTVGYFKRLTTEEAQALRSRFEGEHASLKVTGYGVANKQAAYFSVSGMEEARQFLQGNNVRYEADDPHITFGVSPKNPRDVHDVSKKPQQAFEPLSIEGEFHLQQGQRVLW